MNGQSDNNAGYQLATRIAAVAGVLAIVVCALLLYDYSRRLTKDPLDSPTYKTLVAALDQQPTNETLKEQIRALDLQLRREYFRQRAFARAGAGLLLVCRGRVPGGGEDGRDAAPAVAVAERAARLPQDREARVDAHRPLGGGSACASRWSAWQSR